MAAHDRTGPHGRRARSPSISACRAICSRRNLAEPTLGLRLLHYPPQADEADLYGSAPHTDYGFITMLAQDAVGGLEVRNGRGAWVPAPPIPGTFVMNVGDILTRWSNGRLPSVPHRARNVVRPSRYSMPFFFDAAMDTVIACPPATPGQGARRRLSAIPLRRLSARTPQPELRLPEEGVVV